MPKWLDNAIFYEICPEDFLDTSGLSFQVFQIFFRGKIRMDMRQMF